VRLHRLHLRNFRGVTERTCEFSPAGVTIVVGDNETGKSSLLEALALLFELPDDSKAAKLRAVQPVGRDVGTEVVADVTLGEMTLHYRKQWFRQRSTELRVEPGGQAWTGREAHDQAARLFAEHVDQTLWHALAATQENTLEIPVAGTVTSVLTALDETSGGEVDHGQSVPLVGAVEREYLRYFTPTGRPTGEYAQALAQRDQARVAASEAEQRLAEVEQDVARAERLARDRERLAAKLDEQVQRVEELESRRHIAAELIARVDRLRRDADLAKERMAAAKGELERREALVAELAERERAADEALEAARQADESLRTAERVLGERTTHLQTVREEQAEHRAAVRRFEAQLARLRDRAELTALESRLAEIQLARDEERRLAAELAQLTVDEDVLEAAEAAHREVLAARAALAAGSPKLVLRRTGDAAAVEVAGEPFAGPDAELVVEQEVTISVAGVLELTVRPGAGVGELAAAVADAEHAEARLLADLDATDIADVRRAARTRVEISQALTAARAALARRLGDSTLEELLAERDALLARLDDTDADDSRERLSEQIHAVRESLQRAAEEEAAGAPALAEAEELEALARKQYESASAEATAAKVRAEQEVERRDELVAAIQTARATASDEELKGIAATVEAEFAALSRELAQAEDTLAASGVDRLEERLVETAALRSKLADQVRAVSDELRRVEGRLEMAGIQGLASAAERARAELAHAEARAEAVERKAFAARRLRETLERHRTEARRRYAAPLRERIEALGRIVYGASFQVVLGDNLEVQARTCQGATLPVSSLSTGAREQLATIVRLAIAGLTSADGVPVILDDALGWSDPTRLEAMGSLLARAGQTNQVILLTCTPDRYVSTVPGARIIRIEGAVA